MGAEEARAGRPGGRAAPPGAGPPPAAPAQGRARPAERPRSVQAQVPQRRARLGPGRPRPGRGVDHLREPQRELPLAAQPLRSERGHRRHRHDLGGCRLRAAARRDRPLGRLGERPRGGRFRGAERATRRAGGARAAVRGARRHGDRGDTGLLLRQGRGAGVRGHPCGPAGLERPDALHPGLQRHHQPRRQGPARHADRPHFTNAWPPPTALAAFGTAGYFLASPARRRAAAGRRRARPGPRSEICCAPGCWR